MATASSTLDIASPVVAIVGRPNVGKSALFNRIVGRRQALVDSTPGLTRDRLTADVRWRGVPFWIVDTGGLRFSQADRIQRAIDSQVARAMEEASLALLVCDAREGLLPMDRQIASWLRHWGKPVLVVANKADDERHRLDSHEFASLGLGSPLAISSLHGAGVGDLLDAVVEQLKRRPNEIIQLSSYPISQSPIRVAILGRPNVGKSSLINRLLGSDRVLVDEAPGTTRDPVEVHFAYEGQSYCLVDTAGIRSRRTLKTRMEAVARLKSLQVIRRADVCLAVLEAPLGLVRDDLRLLDEVVTACRPLCLAMNKWDLLDPPAQRISEQELRSSLTQRAPFLRFAPVIRTSAKTGVGVLKLLERVRQLAEMARRQMASGETRRMLERILGEPRAPAGLRHARLIRLTQVGVSPPVFHLLARARAGFRQSDLRFLESAVRREGGFDGVPVQVRLLRAGSKRGKK